MTTDRPPHYVIEITRAVLVGMLRGEAVSDRLGGVTVSVRLAKDCRRLRLEEAAAPKRRASAKSKHAPAGEADKEGAPAKDLTGSRGARPGQAGGTVILPDIGEIGDPRRERHP